MNTELRAMLTGPGVALPGENEIDRLCELEGCWRALARKAVVEAEEWLLAAESEVEKAAAEQKLLDAHRALAEAREWRP